MKTLKLFRTFNEGFQNFRRDKWLTIVTVMVMSLALYLMGVAFFSGYGILNVLSNFEDRVNISMNFDFDVPESEILAIKKEIENTKIEEIKSVMYVSQEEALQVMAEKFKDDKILSDAIKNVPNNPFPATLVIVSENLNDYEKIDKFLTDKYNDKLLDTKKSNYEANKKPISDIHNFIAFVRNVSLGFGLIMILVSILLNLNTIRMSLYANRKEFEIMRLVGASNLYVKLPTIFEGFLYGLTSSIITIIGLVITVFATNSFIQRALPNVKIVDFYTSHMLEIIAAVMISGIVISTSSSYIAIRKYLEK